MERLIDANALGIEKCNPDVFDDKGYAKGWNSVIEILQGAPTVDAVPVVRCGQMPEPKDCARWVWQKDPYAEHHQKKGYLRCSKCRMQALLDWKGNEVPTPYCPNCGAKMDGDEDDVVD